MRTGLARVLTGDFTHVLLLDRGKALAAGPIDALTSRPDLPWSRYGVDAGSVVGGGSPRGMNHSTINGMQVEHPNGKRWM